MTMIELTCARSAHRPAIDPITAITGPNGQWLADIICHLRDDLASARPDQKLPRNCDIYSWVQQSYYPGLLELSWEEAVLSLLSRMQRAIPGAAPTQRTHFAAVALTQLRRATQHSQIWQF